VQKIKTTALILPITSNRGTHEKPSSVTHGIHYYATSYGVYKAGEQLTVSAGMNNYNNTRRPETLSLAPQFSLNVLACWCCDRTFNAVIVRKTSRGDPLCPRCAKDIDQRYRALLKRARADYSSLNPNRDNC
jgi:hypothetical protein